MSHSVVLTDRDNKENAPEPENRMSLFQEIKEKGTSTLRILTSLRLLPILPFAIYNGVPLS